MPRSHPPTLLTLARRTLTEECALARGTTLLLAVSGGLDSSVMLHALASLAPCLGFTVIAHGVDHGLRAETTAELDGAQALAERCGVVFSRSRVTLAPGGNLQARARDARYAVLREAAARVGASAIATAHQADDRAETVLIRLLRGASVSGLGVLGARQGELVRPLIRARRSDLLAHARRHTVTYRDDPSNTDRRYLRTRVRHELLPLLEDLSPGVVAHLTALADEVLAGGPTPALLLDDGRLQHLGRAQRQALRHAALLGRPELELLLTGARRVRVAPPAAAAGSSPRAAAASLGPVDGAPAPSAPRRGFLEEMRANRSKSG